MSTRHLVFDLDDTLYAERDFALGGFRAAASMAETTFGLADGTAASIQRQMTTLLDSGHLGGLFAIALAAVKHDHTSEQLSAFIAAYRNHTPTIALFDDADAALSRFGGNLGMITDGSHDLQRSKVTALGIARHFGAIIYTDQLGGRAFAKPNPTAYELARDTLGKPGDTFVYIGDNPAKDFQAPNTMGWTTIMIRRPDIQRIHPDARAIEGGEPQHIITRLDALSGVLGSVA